MPSNDKGVLYLAFGKPYLAMALFSASTLRRTNPSWPICIITNVTPNQPAVDFWNEEVDIYHYLKRSTQDNRLIKVSLNKHSPFKKTVFLDCDTRVLGDISLAEFFLDHFDIALRLNPDPKTIAGKGNIPVFKTHQVRDFPHWNSGVVMFTKGEKTNAFFDCWRETYKTFGVIYDQVSLVEAIFRSNARILSLNDRWNYHPRFSLNKNPFKNDVKIIHYTSKISHYLSKEIKKYEPCLPSEPDTQNITDFIRSKRKQRRKKIGWLKYLLLRLEWLIFKNR